MATVRNPWADGTLFLLASPVLFVKALRRGFRRYRFFRLATATAIECECGAEISLVGMWRCSCGYTYRGHLLRVCLVCGTIPTVARCFRCGVTSKLPEAA